MSQTEIAESRVRKGERTRSRILNAAASVLAREGYAAATLTEIAAVAKMRAGSLYYHFDSKEAIVEEVLRVGIDHARTAIREALAVVGAQASGRERLNISVEVYIKHITKDSDFTHANIRCFQEAPGSTRANLAVPLREFANGWVSLIEAGQKDHSLRGDIDARVLARMMISAMNSVSGWWSDNGELDISGVAQMYGSTVINGLTK